MFKTSDGNDVSTHSRPKAAAAFFRPAFPDIARFNTQPPEGGCPALAFWASVDSQFQHTAARRRLPNFNQYSYLDDMFQHTAARRRLPDSGGRVR